MLQNREVAGATMGAGGRVAAATFGPWGYVSLAVPVALVAVFFVGIALRLEDPLGLNWAWCALVFIVSISAVSRFAGRRGVEDERRWRAGARTRAYWMQRVAPLAVCALILAGFVAHLAHLPVLADVAVAVAVAATAGVSPFYFGKPPGPVTASRADSGEHA